MKVSLSREQSTLPMAVDCCHNCCLFEVDLATLTCGGFYRISNIGLSFSMLIVFFSVYFAGFGLTDIGLAYVYIRLIVKSERQICVALVGFI